MGTYRLPLRTATGFRRGLLSEKMKDDPTPTSLSISAGTQLLPKPMLTNHILEGNFTGHAQHIYPGYEIEKY